MNLTLIIRNWEDGLISTAEALAQVLCSETIVERRLEAIATIALKLQEQEQAAAEETDDEPNMHVFDWLCKDVS